MTQEGIEGYDSLYDMTNISLLYSYVSDLHLSRCQLKISGNSSRTHLKSIPKQVSYFITVLILGSISD